MAKEKFKETKTFKIVRPNFESTLSNKEKNNITETALDNYKEFDYVIENDGTLDEFEEKIIQLLESENLS